MFCIEGILVFFRLGLHAYCILEMRACILGISAVAFDVAYDAVERNK